MYERLVHVREPLLFTPYELTKTELSGICRHGLSQVTLYLGETKSRKVDFRVLNSRTTAARIAGNTLTWKEAFREQENEPLLGV